MTGKTICWSDSFKKKGRGVDQKTSQYLVWRPFASCRATHLLHVDLIRLLIVVLWNVVSLLFNGCAKLLDFGKNWKTCSIGDTVCLVRPWKNWDIFSFQELCSDPSNMGPCIIMLKHEVTVSGWMAQQWASGSDHDISVHSNCNR
jgi:hypothetical protein